MKFVKALGILFVVWIASYLVFLVGSLNGIQEICRTHPVGTPLSSFSDIDDGWAVHAMGPYENPSTPGVLKMIYCSAPTMCDARCDIEIQNGFVTKSELLDL